MNNLVYHYTSLNALSGIVRNEGIYLWATRYDQLNDPHEQVWAKNEILKRCLELPEYQNCSKEDICIAYPRFSYIISFCEIEDYRNMWRLYCMDGLGLSLGFDRDVLSKIARQRANSSSLSTYDVFESVYYSSPNDIAKAISYWKQRGIFSRLPNEPADELLGMCAFIKDDDFCIENEMRYARIREAIQWNMSYDENERDKIKCLCEPDKTNVQYRMRDNKFIPYIEIDFPPEALKTITIGYKAINDTTKDYIQWVLNQFDDKYKHVEVIESIL